MVDVFRLVIFLLHFAAAITVTVVCYSCKGASFGTGMYADTAIGQDGSRGVWLEWELGRGLQNETCFTNGTGTLSCQRRGLPLYETRMPGVGWHVLPLLGHFEWVSSAFALFYIQLEGEWSNRRMTGCVVLALAGAALCCSYDAGAFWLENLLMWANSVFACWLLGRFTEAAGSAERQRDARDGAYSAQATLVFAEPPRNEAQYARWGSLPAWLGSRLGTPYSGWARESAATALGPVLRFGEYCVTASELIVAVICVFVVDPPLFLPVLAYAGVLACNLCGVMLHLAVVAESDKDTRHLATNPCLPEQQSMLEPRALAGFSKAQLQPRRTLRTPEHWVPGRTAALLWSSRSGTGRNNAGSNNAGSNNASESNESAEQAAVCPWPWKKYHWGDRASFLNNGLLDCWVAYGVALLLVLYQASVLVAPGPPWYVAASGWMLIVSYSSFGVWVTALYLLSSYDPWARGLGCLKRALVWRSDATETEVLENGLDLLSVSAKLSIVGSLVYGYMFSSGVTC